MSKGYKQVIHIKIKSKYENIFSVVKEIKAIMILLLIINKNEKRVIFSAGEYEGK